MAGTGSSAQTRGAPSSAREPLYYRVKREIADLVRGLPPGSAVPTERALAHTYRTSRTTVRQALAELVVEGRLDRQQGRGTFVARPKVAQPLQLSSYTHDVLARGQEPASVLLSLTTERADDTLAPALALRRGASVVAMERLRLADDEPMAIERTYLSAARFPGLRQHMLRGGSLYEALETEYGVRPVEAEQTVETALATPAEAVLLGVDTGLPVLLLTQRSLDPDGVPVEYVRSVYRGDRFRLVTTVRAGRRARR
jgi:GntR family transcriptional regulator